MEEQKIQPKAPETSTPSSTAKEPVQAERTNLVRRIRNGLKRTGRHNMKKNHKPI